METRAENANEALNRAISQLSTHNDLTEFLHTVVREALASSGAVSGAVFLLDRINLALVPSAHIVRGEVVDVTSDPITLAYRQPTEVGSGSVWAALSRSKATIWGDYRDPLDSDWREGRAWHAAMGHGIVCGIPMLKGEEVVGFLALAWDASVEDRPEDARLNTCRVLIQQATLAVRLTLLAEEARTAAVAREREQAAQERANQLERANAMLSSTIETFALNRSPEAFLDATLRAIAAALNVDFVAMWLWPGDGYAYLHRVLTEGVILPGDQSNHPDAGKPRLLAGNPWVQKIMAAGTQIIDVLNLEDQRGLMHAHDARLLVEGVRALAVAAIRSGQATVGTFTARLHEGQPNPGPDQIALMRSLAAHAALALEVGRLTEAVRDGATRDERTRIARDLHDSLAQGFTGIIVQLEAVGSALDSEDLPSARARVAAVGEVARESLEQAQRAVHALRDSVLEDTDLITALRELIRSIFAGSTIEVETHFVGASRSELAGVEEHLLRIAQEALINARKHASARHIRLCLAYHPDEVLLSVDDDGGGFMPSSQRPGAHGGLGLVGIRERADRLGAALTVASQLGGGTSIRVTLPTPARGASKGDREEAYV